MDDNSREIRDNNINAEEIMEKIRENIRRRKATGDPPLDPALIIGLNSQNSPPVESDDTFQCDLSNIHTNWDIHNNRYLISSHHPFIGKFLVKGRELVHGEVCRYVDPVIKRQTEFNASSVRIITRVSHRCAELDQHLHELENAVSSLKQESDKRIADCIISIKKELDAKIELTTKDQEENQELIRQGLEAEIEAKVQKQQLIIKENRDQIEQEIISSLSVLKNEIVEIINQRVLELDQLIVEKLNNQIHSDELHVDMFIEKSRIREKVDARVKELFTLMEEDINARAWLAHVLEDRVQKGLTQKRAPATSAAKENANYFLFEERFRGSREDIKQRQLAFLPYFKKCSRVLDIGCGRGEFLEILKDNTIGGIGVDNDPDMVAYCRSRQLEVEHSDAIAYLETLEDKSLDGIFIDQVVEHLEPDYLIRLLALCFQKIKYGYHIIVETVNPLSFLSFVNFYIDLTHKRPVHPETLHYLFSASGFRECEIKFFSPVSDDSRLKKIERTADMNENKKKNVDIYNNNVEMLNTVLFGAQDYAVIGKK